MSRSHRLGQQADALESGSSIVMVVGNARSQYDSIKDDQEPPPAVNEHLSEDLGTASISQVLRKVIPNG